jgi:glycine dehydrogenase subunit 1
MREVAEQCLEKSHYLADSLGSKPGFRVPFPAPFFQEFVLECPRPAAELVTGARARGVIPGVDLARFPGAPTASRNRLLVCVSEKHTRADLDRLVLVLEEAARA